MNIDQEQMSPRDQESFEQILGTDRGSIRRGTTAYTKKTLMPQIELSLDSFVIEGKLGSGAFGTVHLARMKADGKLYALKEVDKIFV